MQDFFGPGHILTDTVAAGRYLRSELSDSESFDDPLYEPTGYKGNFYRVNLSVIKDGLIRYESPYYADYQHRFIEKNTGKVQILRR